MKTITLQVRGIGVPPVKLTDVLDLLQPDVAGSKWSIRDAEVVGPAAEDLYAIEGRDDVSTVDAGGAVVGPQRPIPGKELVAAYQLRSRHLKAAGKRLPGFDEVTEMLSEDPEQLWLILGIDGPDVGGAVFLKDGVVSGCFAFDERAK